MAHLDADLVDYLHWGRNLRGLSDNTMRVRLDVLYRLSTYLQPVALRDATGDHLRAFERVAIAGRAAETRRAYACHIRAFYRWLRVAERIESDPAAVLTLPLVPRHLPRPIDEQDLAVAIILAPPKVGAMLTLGAWAGLRCCEIAGLEWSDLRRESGDTYLHVRKGKGRKERTVEIGRVVIQALQAYGTKKRGPVFLGNDGAQITANAVSRAINRHLARHDIEATAHQLRHRYGTVGYQLSKDLRMLQEQMGHASADSTAIYTRPSAKAAAAMVAAMDALTLATPPERTAS